MTQIAEKPNRVQGMARSFDQWLNMVPHAVADGSKAQVECALADASHDIEVLWRKVTSQAAEIERLREALKPFSLAYEMAAVLNNEVESGKVARDCVAFMDFRRAYLAIHPTALTAGAAHAS